MLQSLNDKISEIWIIRVIKAFCGFRHQLKAAKTHREIFEHLMRSEVITKEEKSDLLKMKEQFMDFYL